MINVNFDTQGDAHLLIDGSVNVMIDAGEKYAADSAVVPYLALKKINKIHHFFISHPHTDHYGGIESLLDAGIRIENIYYNLPPEEMNDSNYRRAEFLAVLGRAAKQGSIAIDVDAGFTLSLPTSSMKILYAHKGATLANGRKVSINDYSLIMQWDAGGFRTLFTGDLNEPLGAELARQSHYKADILKVPHHGATGVAPDEFFDTVSPSLNMFPSTRALWTHPRVARVKAWTLTSGILYCNNGLNGNVVLTIDKQTVSARSERPTADCPSGILNILPGDKIDSLINSRSSQPAINALLIND